VIKIRIAREGRVDCRAILRTKLSSAQVWGQLRDFHTFARQEFFHAKVEIEGGTPRPGAKLDLSHRFFLFRVHRVGRICRWEEGEGFAFSDLSKKSLFAGFPHIFSYRLTPVLPSGCDIEIRVAGRWTTRFLPRWIVWLWLRWIMQFAVQQVRNNLLLYQVWLARRAPRVYGFGRYTLR